jgi:DNA polymerase (family 10)
VPSRAELVAPVNSVETVGAVPFHRTLEQLALLSRIRGDTEEESVFKRALELVRAHHLDSDEHLGSLFSAPPPGTDPEVLRRLRQMYEAGGWVLLESSIADLPADLRWLFEAGAVTIEQLGLLFSLFGSTSRADLAAAIDHGQIRDLNGLDAETEQAVARALPSLRSAIPRIPLGRATAIAEPMLEVLRSLPGTAWALPAGSLRRGQDTVGDLELIASTARPAEAIEALLEQQDRSRCLHRSARKLYLLIDRIQVGARFPEQANAGAELLYLTGSDRHFQALRGRATEFGWRLTPHGMFRSDMTIAPAATEGEIYSALGLPTIPPEIRNGDVEIEAASRGELPELVSQDDIQGDLHMHTAWSDGRDSIDEMVRSARALGYRYVAITDHSPHSASARNLTADGVKKQADEIGQLRERYADIQILHGCEVDILPDGRLDFPDQILQGFDIVLASLHERADQSDDQLMKRYVTAMNHPLVFMITHPTNRILPHRPGYTLDYDRLFEHAVITRTIVEIDGSPSHLDLDGTLARRAISAGAMVAIDSDCHRSDMLERQMRLGILTARRGWVEPRHVVNTRGVDEVREIIARKRAGR